jgi:hypothetical protein
MARERATGSNDKTPGSADKTPVGVMGGAQEAADRLRASAERAAEHIPDAVAGAQVAARDTQRVLEEMPNQALIVGTSFSLGLGAGLLLTGSNRLLVIAALLPAAAMAATLMSRESGQPQPASRRLSA